MRIERVELCEHPTFLQWVYEKGKKWALYHSELLIFSVHISVISLSVITYCIGQYTSDISLFRDSLIFNGVYWGIFVTYRICSKVRDLYNDYKREIVIEGRRLADRGRN